jgi:PAS domain S-box-containing protein
MATSYLQIPATKPAGEDPPGTEPLQEPGEQQLAEAQQIAQLGSWEWNLCTREMAWSDELFRIVGCEPGSVRPSFEALLGSIHPGDRAAVERSIAETVAQQGCLATEYRVVRPDGSLRAVHCRAQVVSDESGEPRRMIGTAQDVTELRRCETLLTSQIEQFEQLAQASVAIYSAEGFDEILEVATSQALRILGARFARGGIADPRGLTDLNIDLSADGGQLGSSGELLAAVEPLAQTFRIQAGEADRHPVLARLPEPEREVARHGWLAVPLVDLLGGAKGAIQLFGKHGGEFTDSDEVILVQIARITSLALQKARLFEELQVSEERYRRLFDAHLSGDFVSTVDGEFLEVNHAFARILGYDSAEPVKTLNLSHFCRKPGERERLVERIRRQRRAIQYETEFVGADGMPVCAIMNIVGVFDRGGELEALQGCVFDATELKRAEAALRESQQQLLQAQKMEAVGQLAGGIAHDFNNMLMAIQGFADLLDEELPDTASARAHVDGIRSAAERSARLTKQLLAYSRKQVLQPEVLDLNAVVTGIEDMMKRLIGEHIAFTSELDADAGRVHADPGQLQQVLMNLVLNARAAMPDGGRLVVRTGVSTFARPAQLGDLVVPPGTYATLSVADTGHGIAPAVLPRIFEPFFTTKPVGSGSGLGLSTAYGIVTQSGGFICAESRVDEGSTFTLYLPRTDAAAAAGASQAAERSPAAGGATVMVVEDESVLRSLAGIVLRRAGYRVFEAEDGVDALEIAQRNAYAIDVLVTDLVMPRLGGHALSERMLELRPDLKIVFMSGYAEEAVARHGLLAEGSTFLAKPFPPAVLVRAVHEILPLPTASPQAC